MKLAKKALGATCCLIIALLFISSSSAMGDSLTFNPTASTAGDGQSFSFTITLNTTNPLSGFSMYLQSSAANSFSVTGETASGSQFFTAANSNLFNTTFPVLLSTTGNSPDFGYSGTADIAAGTYVVGTISLSVGSNVPNGTFSIITTTGLNGSEYNDVEDHIYALAQATQTISVPEAKITAPIAFILAALLFPLRRRPQNQAVITQSII